MTTTAEYKNGAEGGISRSLTPISVYLLVPRLKLHQVASSQVK